MLSQSRQGAGAGPGALCRVCGGADLSLVDGFYYCIECGTQDANVRETIIEYTAREDGTFAHTTTKKIHVLNTKEEMSPEWYKWHTYNFIMVGLADQMISLGAQPSYKVKLLWIWSQYVKKFRKSDPVDKSVGERIQGPNTTCIDNEESLILNEHNCTVTKGSPTYCTISKMKIGVIESMLYAAANIDHSNIQISDIMRFVKEDRLSFNNCLKFVPKGIKLKAIDFWKDFVLSKHTLLSVSATCGHTMALLRTLDLGKPNVPNLYKLVERYIQELCLPNDFKDLVFSLMQLCPVDLNLHYMDEVMRIPEYECYAMAYIVIGLKMCFGLDDKFENEVSDALIPINESKTHGKAYKQNIFVVTERLFSFKEWLHYMKFRQYILCQHYFPLAVEWKEDIKGHVFTSHTMDRYKRDTACDISEEVAMEILDKLRSDIEAFKAPKMYFPASLTPLTTYTDVLIDKLGEYEIVDILSEDFTQYSLKYITEELSLINKEGDNVMKGISKDSVVKMHSAGKLVVPNKVSKMVHIRNCDNDNWLLTKLPSSKHIKLDNEESDTEYNTDDSFICEEESQINLAIKDNEKIDETYCLIDNEIENQPDNIFMDDIKSPEETWQSFVKDDTNAIEEVDDETPLDIGHNLNEEFSSLQNHVFSNVKNDEFSNVLNEEVEFNEELFDRAAAIETLLDKARKQFLIKKPSNEPQRAPPKRKINTADELSANKIPRLTSVAKNPKPGQVKQEIANICANYMTAMFRNKIKKTVLNLNERSESLNEPESNRSFRDDENITSIVVDNKSSTAEDNQNEIEKTGAENNNEVEDNTKIEAKDKFDSKLYDTRQLYIKIKGDNLEDEKDTSDVDPSVDPELLKIFSKSIKKESVCDEGDKDKCLMFNDIDDGVPLRNKTSQRDNVSCPLMKEERALPYYYWFRDMEIKDKAGFDIKLREAYPRNFGWVLNLCSKIIQSRPFSLYKHINSLENSLKYSMKVTSVKINSKRGGTIHSGGTSDQYSASSDSE